MNALSRWGLGGLLVLFVGGLGGPGGASACDHVGPYLGCSGAWQTLWVGYAPSSYVHENLPYYAVHPPVYYSYPVARTYGYSPYAYPAGVRTPELGEVRRSPVPRVVVNPFVVPKTGGEVPARPAATPKRIVNPFAVEQGGNRIQAP